MLRSMRASAPTRVSIGLIPTCGCGAFPNQIGLPRYSESQELFAGSQLHVEIVIQPDATCPKCGQHWAIRTIEGA